jgi:hypothetical protein
VKTPAAVKRDDGFESVHLGVKEESEDKEEDEDESEDEDNGDEDEDEWEDIGRKPRKPRKRKINEDWQDVNVREEVASKAEKMYLDEDDGQEKILCEKVSAAARVASKKAKRQDLRESQEEHAFCS